MKHTAISPINVTLYGATTCRRYKTMRQRVLQIAKDSTINIDFREENDTAALSAYNPLHLPILMVGKQLVARANPPSLADLKKILTQVDVSTYSGDSSRMP